MTSFHQRTIVLGIATLAMFLMSGNAPSVTQDLWLQHQLAEASDRGISYRFVDSETIEFKENWSGKTWTRRLREANEAAIRAWANAWGIPILEIDPTQIDTNQYAGWYNYWTEVPLSNSEGIPLVVEDMDGDGKPEVYGTFNDYTSPDFEARVYEIDSNGIVSLGYNYIPRPGVSRTTHDVDGDLLCEVLWSLGGSVFDYEQVDKDSLPTHLRFTHERYQGNVSPGYTGIFVGSLDGDSLSDLLYKGSEADSSSPNGWITKVYVAEYNPDSTNFVRVWSRAYVPQPLTGIGGFAVGDFDGDGRTEFAICDKWSGQVFVTENATDNTFEQTWRDSTPFHDLNYLTSGDVDGDGKPEFFVGAGDWTLVYEADSNNSYSLQFLFHLLADGGFDSPTYIATDVDGDGRPDLVIFSGAYIHVFKGRADNDYSLFYLKRETNRHSVQFYDLNRDGIKDFLVSKLQFDMFGRFRFKADVYKATSLVRVDEGLGDLPYFQLLQNYPNPFNSSTNIEYSLPARQDIRLIVYDALGQAVAILVNGQENPGRHAVTWNAEGFASGVYFCRLETVSGYITRKLLLIR